MVRPSVLVTRRLPSAAMERLGEHCDVACWEGEAAMDRAVLLREAAGKQALITLLTERVDGELLEAAGPGLRIVANYAVGVDNIDLGACEQRGVMVSNTPDVLTEATADMAWALLLAAARRLVEGDRLLRAGVPWTWGPEVMLGRDLVGRTLGVVGFGRIGRAVARRASAHSMRVVVHSRGLGVGTEVPFGHDGHPRADAMRLQDLLEAADFVSLHVSLNDESRHLISAAELALMKPTAVLVNTSRGPVVDEEALADALERGTIFAAGLDVFEHEPVVSPRLLAQPRAVLAPHLGSATVDTRSAMAFLAVNNVLAALAGERPPTLVGDRVRQAGPPSPA